jgi:hypothetical protein
MKRRPAAPQGGRPFSSFLSTTCTPRSCTRLTYRNCGRDFRLTDVRGRVVQDIIA